ncbi:MAG TPA: plasma-membrane proton-efflux P-type ATPase [Caulobacteraceae bacterium]|nr:plasma-membrane proton-efflux P-type ATPase [Caulobacteraceae bacterium]
MPGAGGSSNALTPEPSEGLSSAEAAARLARDGPNAVAERRRRPLWGLLRRFWGLSAWMLEVIAALSFALGKSVDGAVTLALLGVNASLGWWEDTRAATAVEALRRRLQVSAKVRRDGAWRTLEAVELVVGDLVRVRVGDFVPADLRLVEGDLGVDQSALTGESRLVDVSSGDTAYSGAVVRRGEATATVTATGARTYFGRTIELVQNARPRLHIDDIAGDLVRRLLAVVGAVVAVLVMVTAVRGGPLAEILPLSLVLLMSAIPVALPVMLTVSMALGAMELARSGVLVTRLSAAEDAANIDVLCADKTGTLTQNRLAVVGTASTSGFADADVVRLGALASNVADQDPIDLAFVEAAAAAGAGQGEMVLGFTPFSPASRRTEASVRGADGGMFRVAKGALRTIAQLADLEGGALASLARPAEEAASQGHRALAVARADEGGPWRLVGLAFVADPPRSDSRGLMDELRTLGVSVKMLTGDALPVARAVAGQLGLGNIVAARDHEQGAEADSLAAGVDGLAEVYPEDKFRVVRALQAAGHVVAMTGDGVNDAPALRQAEVGVAVSSATDVAKHAASVVLTTDGLAGIVELVRSGRRVYRRVLTWIIAKVSRTIVQAGFVALAYLATGRFAISALAMLLLLFMTDFVKVALATDRVTTPPKPESANIGPLVRVAVAIGLAMLAEAMGALTIGWRWFGLARDTGRLRTFSFETLLFFAIFSIVSLRERRAFWHSRPSAPLAIALGLDTLAGAFVGLAGLSELRPLKPLELGFVAGYALVASLLLNDPLKCWLVGRTRR